MKLNLNLNRHALVYLVCNSLLQIGFGLIAPIYLLFIKQAGGLTNAQALYPNLVCHTAGFLLEYPTGIIADKFGKKLSTLIGMVLACLSLVIYGFSTNLLGFCIAELVAAFGLALVSGALDQWLQEKIGAGETSKTQALTGITSKSAVIGSSLVLSFLHFQNLSNIFFLAAFAMFLATLTGFKMEADELTHSHHKKSSFNLAKQNWQEFKTNKNLVRLTVNEALRKIVESGGIWMFWTLFLTSFKNLSLNDIFIVSALAQAGIMLGNSVGLKSNLLKPISYSRVSILKGITLALMLVVPNWSSVSLFVVYEFLEGVQTTKFRDFLNHQILDPKSGASLRSLVTLIISSGRVLGMLIMGPIADAVGVEKMWLIVAIFMFSLGISRQIQKRIHS